MLTLNDEQEKALREWWKWADQHRPDGLKGEAHWAGSMPSGALVGYSAGLHAAIAPLMKPWRVEHYELVRRIVCGGLILTIENGLVPESQVYRACRVLNGEERW